LNGAEKQANTARAEAIRMVGELQKLEAKLALVQNDYNKKIQETKILLKQENDQIKQNIVGNAEQVRIKKLQAIVNKEVAGSYNALDAQYKLNIISLNKLTQEEIENSAAGKKLAADTKIIQSQLQAMDMTTARNRTGYNGLRFSMIQVGRELPSMAYGFNVFMAAISNNLPMVTDEIKKARMELAALKAEGKVGVPIWKQMASAIFSWQTALIAAISILTVFGKQISDSIKALREKRRAINEIKKSTDEYVVSLKKMGLSYEAIIRIQKSDNEVREKTKEAIENEVSSLELLNKTLTDSKIPLNIRKEALKEIQKLYPAYFNNLTTEDFLLGKANSAIKEINTTMEGRSEMEVLQTKIIELNKELEKLSKTSKDAADGVGVKFGEKFKSMVNTLGKDLINRGLGVTLADLFTGKLKPEGQKEAIRLAMERIQKEIDIAQKDLDDKKSKLKYVAPLKEEDKKQSSGGASDDRLERARKENEIKLQIYRKELEDEYKLYSESTEKTLGLGEERDMLLSQRRSKMDEQIMQREYDLNYDKIKAATLGSKYLLDIAKKGSMDALEIEKDSAQLTADIIEETTKRKIDNANDVAKFYDEKLKEEADNEIAKMYEIVDKKAIIDSEEAAKKIKAARGNEEKIAKITDEYQEKLIDNEIDGITMLLSLNDEFYFLSEKQVEDFNTKLRELQKKRNEEEFDDFKKNEKLKLEFRQRMTEQMMAIINAGFAFQQQLSDNQLARAERNHELELLAATESAEGRMAADAKYDKKKREIEKRQATLKKASAAFNIVVDTAQAIMNFLATKGTLGIILAAAAGITGGIELATVLSEPIPAYNKGVEGAKGGWSILGDKDSAGHGGVELVEEPSGKKWLSGSEPALYDITPGSDIYPSDETQKILAQQAFNNSFNIIGLGETNSLLKSINTNTKNPPPWQVGDYEYVKHGTITTRYAIRRR